jgi:hypothetical protein
MKTKLVTALYTQVSGFPFFGHRDKAREHRYLHSLRTISNTKCEIVLFCNLEQYDFIKSHCEKHNLSNVQIKISELKDYKHANKMMEIKKNTEKFQFYHEIDWNKIYLLEKEYDESYDYIYWIDCGLSHPGLFLDKYNPSRTGSKIDFSFGCD